MSNKDAKASLDPGIRLGPRGSQRNVGCFKLSQIQTLSESEKRLSREFLTLSKADWPKDTLGNPAWPNCLTVSELPRAMRYSSGLTKTVTERKFEYKKNLSSNSQVFSEFSNNAGFRRKVVSDNLLGVRLGEDIPVKYRKFFRYKWNHLILLDTFLPLGLVNYLVKVWKDRPTNLWLVEQLPIKKFLKCYKRSAVA